MRSLIGALLRPRNDTPVPYVGRRASAFGGSVGASGGGPLDRMGQVGTLFAIVNRTSTACAEPEWALYRTPTGAKPAQDTDRQQVITHAALSLWGKWNPFMTGAAGVEVGQQHIDLAGESFLVVVKAGKIPIELWPVRPDRMIENPHPTKFLAGWLYKTPDGEKIPLGTDEVIHLKMPNPTNPYRGMGPVQALLAELDSAQAATEWSRNFFQNSAQPGGIIEVPDGLSDDDFHEMTERWNEQHRGVQNAHRVAIIEHGVWKDRSFSPRDLDFSSLRNLSRDAILEAYGISRSILGLTDGVNYAAAKAADTQFAKLVTKPRLRRWKEALNAQLLPMFGATAKGVEFDFESPVPADDEAENAERTSRVGAVVQLLSIPTVKFEPKATLEAFGLPDLPYEEVEPPPPVAAPPAQPEPAEPTQDEHDLAARAVPRVEAAADLCPACTTGGRIEQTHAPCDRPRNADDEPDLSELQKAWERAVDRVLDQWQTVTADQRAQLRRQITDAVDDGDLARLASLTADSDDAAQALAEAMEAMARTAAQHVVDEAAAQGVTIPAATPPADDLLATAATVAALLAAGLALEAGREALRVHRPGMTGSQVATAVDEHLRGLSDRGPRDAAGGALTGAQNAGMRATYSGASAPGDDGLPGPVGSIYATEVNDANRCSPCAAHDGRFVCTTEDLAPYDRLYTALGGYVECLGGVRCRGSVTGVWRPQTVDDA